MGQVVPFLVDQEVHLGVQVLVGPLHPFVQEEHHEVRQVLLEALMNAVDSAQTP